MDNEQEIIKLNCILKGQTAERFDKIKQSKGLESKTEVVRAIINEYYNSTLALEKEAPVGR